MSDQEHAEKDPPPQEERRRDLLGDDPEHPRKPPLDPISAGLEEEAESAERDD